MKYFWDPQRLKDTNGRDTATSTIAVNTHTVVACWV